MVTLRYLGEFSIELCFEVANAAGQLASRLGTVSSFSPRKVARKVPRNLSRLGAILLEIAFDLQNCEVEDWGISKIRFHKFLFEIEAICKWPNPPDHTLLDLERIRDRTSKPKLLAASLEAWATEKHAKRYIASFEKFLPRAISMTSPSLKDLFPGLEPIVEQPIPDAVSKQLYETIARDAQCRCSNSSTEFERHFQGRLRLMEQVSNDWANNYLFDTAFIAPADMHQSEPLRCQLMRFHVPTTRKVAFVDLKDTSLHREASRSTLLDVQDFCHLVRRNVGAVKLGLRVRGTKLLNDPEPIPLEAAEYPVQPVPSISLKEVLRMQHLTTRDRLVVAYILAKSVWQYYTTDWLNTPWTTDNIHFLMEEREDDQLEDYTLNPARPYLAFADIRRTETMVSEYVDCCVNHRFPRILALGVIMVELCRKEPHHRIRDNSTLEAFVNNNLFDNLRTINKDASWPHLELDTTYRTHFRDAVAACFNYEKLRDASGQNQDLTQAAHSRRDLLWEEVVAPLQRICRVMNLIDDNGAIVHGTHHVLRRAHLYGTIVLKEDSKSIATYPQPQGSVTLGAASGAHNHAQRWLDEITQSELVRNLFVQTLRPGPCNPKPVRIAILDTGYDASNDFFTPARKRRIKWRDFIESGSSDLTEGRDSAGHGTDVLSIALRVAPFAEFYVARVFENSDNVAARSSEIAKAIKSAVRDHDVDIISMSFGFTEEQEEIRDAITEALSGKNEKILFFAAAANKGANEPEMYPARDYRVFAIRASNHEGHWWKSNPPVDTDQHRSFMTLGQKVPSVTRAESLSGTSYATPIAAGFAAMILADVRLSLTTSALESDVKLLNRLSRHDGMRKVLGELSVKSTPRCSYLNPMKFTRKEENERLAILRYAN